ncbi:MAG TPA: hypothetical protein VJ692_14560 [Nitrospiraceae bacterium]|nr:hypothetical protein [Nitrospiraceae bacterium]
MSASPRATAARARTSSSWPAHWHSRRRLAGLQLNPLLIAGGYVAHGFWDLFHHRHGPYADTPHWYIPFCVVYDWILGAFLLVWWW